MKVLSIDLETTGLDPDRHQIIEVGAVLDDLADPQPLDTLPRFHTYVLPPEGGYVGDPFALSMHPTLLRRIAKQEPGYDYLHPQQVASSLRQFMQAHLGTEHEKVTLAGKNVGTFDLPFLKRLPDWGAIRIHKSRVADPGILYWTLGDTHLPSLPTCLERAGLDPNAVTHNAVDDALCVLQALRHKLL